MESKFKFNKHMKIDPTINGNVVTMTLPEYENIMYGYNKHVRMSESHRIKMIEKYHTKKKEELKNKLLNKDLTDQEIDFILEHTS